MTKQAVILCGGLGTRLGALTRETPKPLLNIGGKPFLWWLIDRIRSQGLEEILLLAGFHSDQVVAATRGDSTISVLTEPAPLGTGGALRFALPHLHERFLFLNGDSLFDVPLAAFIQAAGSGPATLALRDIPDVSRYGAAELSGDDIVAFNSDGERHGPGCINGGVAVLSREVAALIDPDRPVSIEREIYPTLASRRQLRGLVYDAPFIDIGVPEDLHRAQTFIPELLG
jgi:NDP-sugar pyrophosphorylase family protein